MAAVRRRGRGTHESGVRPTLGAGAAALATKQPGLPRSDESPRAAASVGTRRLSAGDHGGGVAVDRGGPQAASNALRPRAARLIWPAEADPRRAVAGRSGISTPRLLVAILPAGGAV